MDTTHCFQSFLLNICFSTQLHTVHESSTLESALIRPKQTFTSWVELVSDNCSIHGYVWYNRFNRNWLKNSVFLFIMLVTAGMPPFLWYQLQYYLTDDSVTDGVQWTSARYVRYPNITVCHPKYFSKRRLMEMDMDERMASYLAMTFDPLTANYARREAESNANFELELTDLGQKLDKIKQDKNLSLIEIYRKVSMRCVDIIHFCDIRNELLNNEQCCEQVFDNEPFFTAMGTCYYTKKAVFEDRPLVTSAIRIVTNQRSRDSPDFLAHFEGKVNAIDLRAIVFAMSGKEHPASTLMFAPQFTRPATAIKIALSFSQVSMAPTVFNGFCASAEDIFSEKFNMIYTKESCRLINMASFSNFFNCTLLPWLKIENSTDKRRICGPQDVFHMKLEDKRREIQLETFVEEGEDVLLGESCKHECLRIEYDWKISEGLIEIKSIEDASTDIDPNDLTLLHIYFETLDFARHELRQESFLDFLSKVGGWFGLLFGASIVSFLEVMGFIIMLCLFAFRRTLDFP